MKHFLTLVLFIAFASNLVAQKRSSTDTFIYSERGPSFYYDSIQPAIREFGQREEPAKQYSSMDFTGLEFPTDPENYTSLWHNKPLSQGATGTCWCFAGTSFIESEVYRITGQKVKLSEMHTVYWEYVERAKYFVKNRGNMNLGQGSESNAVTRIMKNYGAMPLSAYSGKLQGQKYHDHGLLFKEIKSFLEEVREDQLWNEEFVVNTVKSILNHHLGTPPETFTFNGKSFTATSFMEILRINPDDYFCFMSTTAQPYNQKGVLNVPDNWWQSDAYYNVDPETFVSVLTYAIDNGYTVSICGDVSEPGYNRYQEVGIIPDFDIPNENINASAREFRFQNKSTTDDHCIHIVGYQETSEGYWFLIKDSSSTGFDGPHKGYMFMREDYVKLKVLGLMTHKYAAKQVMDKIIK